MIIVAIAVSAITRTIYSRAFVKQKETDDRNIDIDAKAKAKAFDMVGIMLGILILIYAFLNAHIQVIAFVGVAYLLIYVVYMFYFSKYHKEM
ncbi:hypothetical protein C1I91_02500 [Clostridium manihotivorum]|uniref:Uncharacterized protein n=2 Tax=Clostridium manihotivorum TaxID=2320868 RepID=A0A410E1G2_9CLOT|nr:hypothetical protein C1I91_02500 [Clostridium manihotivorum]